MAPLEIVDFFFFKFIYLDLRSSMQAGLLVAACGI